MYYEIEIEHYNRKGQKIDINKQNDKIEKITEEVINRVTAEGIDTL